MLRRSGLSHLAELSTLMCVVSRDILLRTNMLGRRKLIGKPLVLDELAMEERHPRSSVDTASQDHVVASTKGASVDEK